MTKTSEACVDGVPRREDSEEKEKKKHLYNVVQGLE